MGEQGEEFGQQSARGPSLARHYGRTRTYAFLYSFAAVTFAYVDFFVEREELIASFDDLAVVGIAVICLCLIAARWRRPSLMSVVRLNDALFVLGLWMVVFSVFGLEVENGFADDLLDEVPKLGLSIVLVANRVL